MPLLVRLFIVISAVVVLFATALASLTPAASILEAIRCLHPDAPLAPICCSCLRARPWLRGGRCRLRNRFVFTPCCIVEHRSPGLLRRLRAPTANERLAELHLRLRRRA